MRTILVIANETLGGRPLLEAVMQRAKEEETHFVVCVPRTRPRHGNIIYDDAVFQTAQVRIDLARAVMREEGIDVVGEVGDPDPFAATIDAVAEHSPDEIIISTLPATSSGWMRRDLIERVSEATGIPVHHVVADIDEEGLPFPITLTVANRTTTSSALLDALKDHARDHRHLFIVVVPQEGGEGLAGRQAQQRLTQLLDRMRSAGLIAGGMIGDPDPYTATMNALASFRVDDVVISTLPETRSGWLRGDLIERVRKASNKPVDHIVAEQAGSAA